MCQTAREGVFGELALLRLPIDFDLFLRADDKQHSFTPAVAEARNFGRS
jgi:hypothetical protein